MNPVFYFRRSICLSTTRKWTEVFRSDTTSLTLRRRIMCFWESAKHPLKRIDHLASTPALPKHPSDLLKPGVSKNTGGPRSLSGGSRSTKLSSCSGNQDL